MLLLLIIELMEEDLVRVRQGGLEQSSSSDTSIDSLKRISRRRCTLLEGCSADLRSNRRLVRRSLSEISWSSWRSVRGWSELDDSGVADSGLIIIPAKEDGLLVRRTFLVVVGLVFGFDMLGFGMEGLIDGLIEFMAKWSCWVDTV
jgi:hypothetical protein